VTAAAPVVRRRCVQSEARVLRWATLAASFDAGCGCGVNANLLAGLRAPAPVMRRWP
jgi:hypothetical protein